MVIYFAVLLLYLLLSVTLSIQEALKQNDIKLLFLLPITFFVIHFSYGWGYIKGIIRFIIRRKKNKNINISR